jgi:hypothetical protein
METTAYSQESTIKPLITIPLKDYNALCLFGQKAAKALEIIGRVRIIELPDRDTRSVYSWEQ